MDRLDAGLGAVLEDLFARRMDSAAFEQVVAEYWASGRFVRRGPEGTGARIRAWADRSPDARYGADEARVKFGCSLLFGESGSPGAFHVRAPGESIATERLASKNRAPHAHETGRITVITGGSATFYVHRCVEGRDVVVEVPVGEDDVLFWPPWAVHTFDAGAGFSLLSAMGTFLTPETEHFLATPPGGLPDLDALPRVSYRDIVPSGA